MIRRRRFLAGIGLVCARAAHADAPCCGPITPAGERLQQLLDATDVEHRWLAHQHVDWQTGLSDRDPDYTGSDKATHCSALAAAVGLRLGVYMLRPPEHGLTLLASAQTRWFGTPQGVAAGWSPVTSMQAAQSLGNQGKLVVIAYPSPDPHRPGHIVVVRPSQKSAAELAVEGPQVIQAASRNKASYPAAQSFNAHRGAWPNEVRVFAHDVPAS